MLRNLYNGIYESNRYAFFIFLVVITVLTTYVNQQILITEEHYHAYFQDQLEYNQVSQLLQLQQKWSPMRYVFIPVYFLLKFSLISLWIMAGVILFGYRVSFRPLFHTVMLAEVVWLLPAIFTMIWFGLFKPDFSLGEINDFQFLSLMHFFDAGAMDAWLKFTLKSMNLFVLIYVAVLAIGIGRLISIGFRKSLKFTSMIFLFGYFLWIIFVDFLTINLIP